jgi:hypothetical protein
VAGQKIEARPLRQNAKKLLQCRTRQQKGLRDYDPTTGPIDDCKSIVHSLLRHAYNTLGAMPFNRSERAKAPSRPLAKPANLQELALGLRGYRGLSGGNSRAS